MDVLGQRAPAHPQSEVGASGDPDQLADDEPERDRPRKPARGRIREYAAAEVDTRIAKREQRDDDERADRMQPVLEDGEHGSSADGPGRG